MSPLDSQDIDRIAARVKADSQAPHPTAEQPVTVSEKVRVAWPVLLVLLAAFGAASVAIAQGQTTATKVEKLETAKEVAKDEVSALRLQAAESKAENKSEHKAMVDLLQDIKSDLKDLKAEVAKKK